MGESPSSTKIGLLALYGSLLLLALNGLFAKGISLDALTITPLRSAVACVFLFALLMVKRETLRLANVKQYLGVGVLGVLLGLHWITYFHAMQISSVAIGMLALFSYPVMIVVFEPVFKGHLPKVGDLFAALVVFVGIFLMVSESLLAGDWHGGTVTGAFWGVFSALLFAVRNTAQKYLFQHVNAISLMAYQTVVIAVLFMPFANVQEVPQLPLSELGALVVLGVFSTALAHTLLSKSLKHLSAKSVSLISCLTPVLGGLLAWMFLGEKPGLMVYLGGGVILSVAIFETVKQHSR